MIAKMIIFINMNLKINVMKNVQIILIFQIMMIICVLNIKIIILLILIIIINVIKVVKHVQEKGMKTSIIVQNVFQILHL